MPFHNFRLGHTTCPCRSIRRAVRGTDFDLIKLFLGLFIILDFQQRFTIGIAVFIAVVDFNGFAILERGQRTLRRKLREGILAWRITRRFSKDEILSLYLNQTYFGQMSMGVEAAAQTYFGKPVSELDLAECALAGRAAPGALVVQPIHRFWRQRAFAAGKLCWD